jgi:hypothetical protein
LEFFLSSHRIRFAPIDRNTTEYYAKIYKELRSKGKPIPTNDLWIAATAMQYGGAIFTHDSHFEHITDLIVISTSASSSSFSRREWENGGQVFCAPGQAGVYVEKRKISSQGVKLK